MAGYKQIGDESPNEGWKRGKSGGGRSRDSKGGPSRRSMRMSKTSKNGIKKNHR
jgi:hypothetical protein